MPPGYKPSRRLKLGRSLALPLAAVGMTILLPWRAADLLHQWEALSTPAAAAQSLPAPVTPGNAPASGATQPGQAGAQPAQRAAPGQAAAAAKTPASAAGMLPGADRAADGRLLSEIAQRTAVLDQRDSELQTRAAQVAAAEQLARQQIAELTRLRQEVEKLVAHESGASEADLNLLVGLYSNMKPAQAAAVLGRLQPPMAAEILQRLDTHAAGPVLAAMDPAAALAITEVLTQRREAFRK
jgi:flagellar motility protein MotE (MotC chaperone)